MVKNISAKDMMQLIDKGARVIDIRDRKEFNEEHVNGSINVDINEMNMAEKFFPYKEDAIIVICASGIRSIAAAEELSGMGYRNIYNLAGGFRSIR